MDAKVVTELYSDSESSPLGPHRNKNDPKIKSKSNFRIQTDKNHPKIRTNSNFKIQGIIENESCSTTCVDPKTVFESHIKPKYSPLGPKKVKNYPVRNEGNKDNKSCCTI